MKNLDKITSLEELKSNFKNFPLIKKELMPYGEYWTSDTTYGNLFMEDDHYTVYGMDGKENLKILPELVAWKNGRVGSETIHKATATTNDFPQYSFFIVLQTGKKNAAIFLYSNYKN